MIMRLIERIMLVINQQIYSNENEHPKEHKKAPSYDASSSPPSPPLPLPPPLPPLPPIIPLEEKTIASDNSQQGWASWAWSYVPSVTTLFAEDDLPPDENNSVNISIEEQVKNAIPLQEQNTLTSNNNNNIPTPLLFAGIDLDRISLQYKVNFFYFKLKSNFLIRSQNQMGKKLLYFHLLVLLSKKRVRLLFFLSHKNSINFLKILLLNVINQQVQQLLMVNLLLLVFVK